MYNDQKAESTCALPYDKQECDLQDMKHSAERMDESYGAWVDYVLVKEDPVGALEELQVVLERVQVERQWVPVSWVRG